MKALTTILALMICGASFAQQNDPIDKARERLEQLRLIDAELHGIAEIEEANEKRIQELTDEFEKLTGQKITIPEEEPAVEPAVEDKPNPPAAPDWDPGQISVVYSESVSASDVCLPRCLMIVLKGKCPPCAKMEAENEDLISETESTPVQLIDHKSNKWLAYGLSSVDTVGACPAFFILDKEGKIHRITDERNGNLKPCKVTGYMTPDQFREYLVKPSHEVNLNHQSSEGTTLCKVESLAYLPEALAGHLARSSDQYETALTSGLFDIDVDVEDSITDRISTFLKTREFRNDAKGIVAKLPELTAITIQQNTVKFSKPLQVTYKGKRVAVSAELHSIAFSPDGRQVVLDLQKTPGSLFGIPNLTITLT